jgi:hypothetical protein
VLLWAAVIRFAGAGASAVQGAVAGTSRLHALRVLLRLLATLRTLVLVVRLILSGLACGTRSRLVARIALLLLLGRLGFRR